MPPFRPLRSARRLLAPSRASRASMPLPALLLAVAGGCSSLDTTNDRAETARAVETRIGVLPGWQADPLAAPLWQGEGPLGAALAIEIALHHEPEVLAALPRLQQARAALAEAQTPPNPTLRWAAGIPLGMGESVPLAFELMQHLGWLLQREALVEIADRRLQAEILAVADRVVRRTQRVAAAHAATHHAERRADLARDAAALATVRFELEQSRLAAGEGSPLDLALAIAAVARSDQQTLAFDRAARLARIDLLRAIGLPLHSLDWRTEHAEVAGSGDPYEPLREAADATLVAIALRERLDLLAAEQRLHAAAAEIGLANRLPWSDLSLGVGFEQDMEGERSVMFGGSIPLPIFDDGSIGRTAATARAQSAWLDLIALRQDAAAETRAALESLRSGAAAAQLQREQVVPAARRSAGAALARYEEGLGEAVAWLDAALLQVEAEDRLAELEGEEAAAAIALQRAIGGGLHRPAPIALRDGGFR
jgi:outer membrane protein TolC